MSAATEEKKAPANNPDLGLLEEDDEFEEFPAEEWETKDEDQSDVNVWEDNWDDDTVEDDFSVQLKKFSRKRSLPQSQHSPPPRSPEPQAKKVCSRPSPAATANGHNGTAMQQQQKEEEADANSSGGGGGQEDLESSESSSSRGRRSTTRSASRSSSNNATESPARTTPTRTSARLRSSRK